MLNYILRKGIPYYFQSRLDYMSCIILSLSEEIKERKTAPSQKQPMTSPSRRCMETES